MQGRYNWGERDRQKGNNSVGAIMIFMVLLWHEKMALCVAFGEKFREGREGCRSQVSDRNQHRSEPPSDLRVLFHQFV
jgi:hypothetical protein